MNRLLHDAETAGILHVSRVGSRSSTTTSSRRRVRRGRRRSAHEQPAGYAACPTCCNPSSAMLTSRTPSVTGGSHRRSTTRSRSPGVSSARNGFVRGVHRVEVLEERLGPLGRVPGAPARRCARIPCSWGRRRAELRRPSVVHPDLIGREELRERGGPARVPVPDQPCDRVGARRDWLGEALHGHAGHGGGGERRDPVVELAVHGGDIHPAIPAPGVRRAPQAEPVAVSRHA